MFCWQCEQTHDGIGCRLSGVCGLTPQVSALMDLLMACLKRLARAALAKREAGRSDREADRLIVNGLAATLSNTNFDQLSLSMMITDAEAATARVSGELGDTWRKAPDLGLPESVSGREAVGAGLPLGSFPELDASVTAQVLSLREGALYGVKGVAGLALQALSLGREDEEVYEGIERVLAMSLDPRPDLDDWMEAVAGIGRTSLRVLEILDEAHTTSFGHPAPTLVSLGRKRGKAVLVSGHSLGDLAAVLELAEEAGVNVYTHGEMFPALAYPGLARGALVGHYGTSWPNQDEEMRRFPGPVVLAGGCLRRLHPAYKDRVFCAGAAAWPGAARIEADIDGHRDFRPVIEAALEAPGFDTPVWGPFVTVGWARRAVLDRLGAITKLFRSGRLRSILVVGGCDGAQAFRLYSRRLVELSPPDSLIITMGCGKSRFLDLSLGGIDHLPRLMDMGQCCDVYSALVLMATLSRALEVPLDELPVHVFWSWHEQKGLAILTAMSSLGVGPIRIGPTLPAFLHQDVIDLLGPALGIKSVIDPEKDLEAALAEGRDLADSKSAMALPASLAALAGGGFDG
jgi:hydroxylamine reductase